MSGANMFVMYTSSNGNNVTISPRRGVGNVQPQHDKSTNLQLLEGSGVSKGVMTANVRCSNCHSWNGGSMDFSSSSASWIYAVASGSSLDSNDLNADISMHGSASSFDFDLPQARGGSTDVNPFGSASNATGTSGSGVPSTCTPITSSTRTACPTSWPPASGIPSARPTWAAGCFEYGPPNGWRGRGGGRSSEDRKIKKRADGCPAGYEASNLSTSSGIGSSSSRSSAILLAHGVLASLAFVALFPIGGILIRIASFTGLVWVHVAVQILAALLYIAAFGLGLYMAMQANIIRSAHPIIGIVLLIIVVAQPITGWVHHKLFKKNNTRTLWSYVHLWSGRGAIVLGMINGGLGLALAGTGRSAVVAYSVIAGVVGLVYIAVVAFAGVRHKNRSTPPKYGKHQRDHAMESLDGSEENTRHHVPGGEAPPEYYGRRSST